ncbi:MAG: hypothetical protein OXI33_03760 [Chloroflexota bacterium]|nr:hypothetical protein [Chloroflexota bacterium]
MYVPEVRGRVEEGARKYEYRLEELERAEENATHVRAVGGRSRRWLWSLLAVVALMAVLFVIFQVAVPSNPVIIAP